MRTKKSKLRKAVPARRWTKAEEMALFNGVSISGVSWFARHTGRTIDAVYAKLRHEYGPGGLTRGAYTLFELYKRTGYSRCQFERARLALNQKWKRLGPRGAHLITEEQQEEMVAWLQHDYWSARLRRYTCVWCSTTSRPAKGLGLCGKCYYRYRRFCEKHGIPVSPQEQAQYLVGISSMRLAVAGFSDTFVQQVIGRMNMGIVVDETDLDALVSVWSGHNEKSDGGGVDGSG